MATGFIARGRRRRAARLARALVGAAVAASCSTTPEPQRVEQGATRVTTITAAVRARPGFIEVGGVVQARTSATVSSRIVAAVASVPVAAGDRVRAGQTLVVLDSRDLDANRRGAAAAVTAEAEAIRAAEADRDAAASALTLATASHGRVAQLHAKRASTPHELDQATGALAAAEARHAAAVARIAAATAALEARREEATAATVAASFAAVTAPFSGTVTETFVDPGDLASPGVPLLRLDDTTAFTVEAELDESAAALVATDQQVTVHLDASAQGGPPAAFSGRVIELARSSEGGRHGFIVTVQLSGEGLRSGLFARVRLPARARDALTVPREALVYQGQLPTLFVVSAGRARARVVRAGDPGPDVEIVAGLAPGEQVIVAPPPSLRDGDRVEPTAASAGGS